MEPADWHQYIAPGVFILAMLVMFWWIVVRPSQVRQRKHQDLIEGLMPGDDVITVGGIHGKITKVGDDSVEIAIARDVTIKLERRAIRRLRKQEDF